MPDVVAQKIWSPDHEDEPDEVITDKRLLRLDLDSALELWVEEQWSDTFEYASEVDVRVRCSDGSLKDFTVVASPSTTFMAREKK